MKNKQVAEKFYEIADLLEIQGTSPFHYRAYRQAAQTIETLGEDIESVYQDKKLQSLPGIGDALAKKIEEIIKTDHLSYLERLRQETPQSLIELMHIPQIGPKKALALYQKRGIATIEQLKHAAENGDLQDLDGFGKTTEENILKGIRMIERTQGRSLLGYALHSAEKIISYMKKQGNIDHISMAGSLRRMKETIGDIDILVATASDPLPIMEFFKQYPLCQETVVTGDTKTSIRLTDGIQVDLRVVKPESFGAALQYFTGSKEHNIHLRTRAKKKGLTVSEYNVHSLDTGEILAGAREEDVYASLNLAYIPPELRENKGEIDAAQKNNLPHLITVDDIRGDFHVHTTYSDGGMSLEDMARMATKMGYEYMGITDHSASLKIAHGLSVEKLEKQIREIHNINKQESLHLFSGTECDIKRNGTLDYPNSVLKKLDFVIASIHTHFSLSRREMTHRILQALENDYVTILGHPTGRLIGRRDPYEVDMEKIIQAARDHTILLEINAFPDRLDLKDTHARYAKDHDCRMALGTDAHHTDHLTHMQYGVATARRGWLEKKDVLNTMSLAEVKKFFGCS